METRRVDVAVIGAGTAGLNARRAALGQGASVLLIEDGPYGTTCARVGCMPSKLLIAAADVAHDLRQAGRFGVHAGEVRVDGPAVLERVRRERDRFVGFVVRDVEAIPTEQRLRGRAVFVGPTALEVRPVDGAAPLRVAAGAVVIATGSASWTPPVLVGAGDRMLHNDDLFELPNLPRSVAVVGTGVIGIELGQALHRLGVRTAFLTIDDMIGPLTDPAVKASARAVFGGELELHMEVRIDEVERTERGVRLRWTDRDGQTHDAEHERLLAATGRRPNVSSLGLEQAGIELGVGGVPLFDPTTMQCGGSPIFVAGDVTDDRPVLHEASDEGQIAGANAARYPDVQPRPRRFPLTIVFADPQIAIVGASYAALVAAGADFAVGEVDYGGQGRARVMGKNAGLVRIYGRRSDGRLIGAEMLGPRVEHTAQLLAWAGQQGMTVDQMLALPFYHPVVEEGIRTALRDLAAKLS